MKAKIKPRIDLVNRTKLETVIPLSVPFIINVDPADTCNFQCKFCPTGDRDLMKKTLGRNHGAMDFKLYQKIIDDICGFEKPIKVLRLYKDGEPLLNPRFAEMVGYAKRSKCADRIDTTTNAVLLNPARNIEIIEAGLDRINISIEGINAEQYREFSKCKVDFEKLVENIRHLYEHKKNCEIIVKINGDILSEDDKTRFYEIFGDIADGVYIEHIMSCWPEFELKGVEVNQEYGIYGQKIKEVLVCPYVFYSFSINSDGTASICFLDWSRKLIVGNAKTERVTGIWSGERLREYQRMFLSKKRKSHQVCCECGQLSHGQPDDIDEFAEMLLDKLRDK
ncbi:MAG: radical SAM/SPASM domain-containing protein [Candidatus Wallbacteria bacterium]|nr:radical SAM/SPASM domain-containing protein [Candidatus Wallbacteria bacterium]